MSKPGKFRKRMTRKKPAEQIDIAKERIEILFAQAQKEFLVHPELSDRYVEIARKISMKFNLPIEQKYRKRFCDRCMKYLVYGVNSTVRLDSERKNIVITCAACKNRMRYGYSRTRK